jgi:hypothetical protein
MHTHNDSTILAAVINADFNPRAAAHALSVPLSTILIWSAVPENRAKLDDALAATEFYLHALELRARTTAIETLTALNASSDDPVERRRIATALLKCAPRARARAVTKPEQPNPNDGFVFDYEGFMRNAELKRAAAIGCLGGPAVPAGMAPGGPAVPAGAFIPLTPETHHGTTVDAHPHPRETPSPQSPP